MLAAESGETQQIVAVQRQSSGEKKAIRLHELKPFVPIRGVH
jgi:hypothetical protein